ncbi:MAG: PGF-CTERM sorting domain-containing protein [Thermoplasmatota archaeon]
MNRTVYAVLLTGMLAMAPLAGALDVTVSPETPAPHEQITATFPAPAGAVNATIMVCIGDTCYIPAEMERQGDVFTHTFYINETGEAHLNISVEHQDGSMTWDNETAFEVREAGSGNGTPGFAAVLAVAALVAVAVLVRRTKS